MADSLDLLAVDAGLDSSQPVAGLDLLADPNKPGAFKRGLGAGIAGVKSSLYGAGALAARGAGAILPAAAAPITQGLEAAALENVRAQNEIAASQSMRYEDVLEDPTRAGEYAMWALGSAAPSLAFMAVGGGAGAVAGRALGATKLGALVGAAGVDTAVEAGSIYPEALETKVENPATRAALGGAAAGAVDFLTVPAAFRAVTAVGKATKAGPGAMVREILTRAPKVGGAEAAQELTQTIIERAAAGQSLTDPAAVSNYINSALVGGIAGLAIGGVAGGVHGLTTSPVQETPPFTNPEQPPEVNNPDPGTIDPILGTATPAEQFAYFTQQHTAATQQLATLEPAVAAAQQAHDAAVARREELTAEAKLPIGERRTMSEITVEKKAIAKQIEAAKKETERLGGELYNTRATIAGLTPQLEAAQRLIAGESDNATVSPVGDAVPNVVVPNEGLNPAIAPKTEVPASDVVATSSAPVVTEQEHINRAVVGVQTLMRDRGMMPTINDTIAAAGESLTTPMGFTPVEASPREVALAKVQQRGETTTQPNQQAQMSAIEPHAMAVIEPIAMALAKTKTDTPGGQAKIAKAMTASMRSVVQEAAKLQSVEAAQQYITDKLPKALKGHGVQVDAPDMAKAVSAAVGQAKTQYSKGATAPKDDYAANLAFYLQEKTGSVLGKWEGKMSAADQRKLFGRAIGKGNIIIDGKEETVSNRVRVGFGQDYDDRNVTAWRDLTPVDQSNAALTQDEFDTLPEPAKYAAVDEFNRVMMAKGTRLRERLLALIGHDPTLKISTFMATPNSPIGSYTRVGPLKSVITLALNAKDELSIADHEGYHYAEDRLLDARERRIVANAMKPGRPLYNQLIAKLQAYDQANGTNLTDEVSAIPAEARAYAFEFWRRGELKAEGPVARAFQIIRNFLEKVSNLVRGLGFTSIEDVFTALDRGQFAERTANSGETTENAGELPMMLRQQAYSKSADYTQTPEFKKWFGDSKVVDAEGKPLVVYHGTQAPANFAVFKGPVYFSDTPGESPAAWAQLIEPDEDSRARGHRFIGAPRIIPAYLSLKNIYDADRGSLRFEGGYVDPEDMGRKGLVKFLESKGYDGVKYSYWRGMLDNAPLAETVYIAFHPTQIKSAIGNSGAFDPTNPDIRFSRGAVATATRSALAEMTTRFQNGELERTQLQQAWTTLNDNAQIPDATFKFATGLAKAEVGGLRDWWFKHIATPNYVSRFSAGYKNVMNTLNTYIRYRKILAEQMLREKLPSWYKASDVDRKAAFGVMLKRTVENYSKSSTELAALMEPLTTEQRKLYDQATSMIEGFLRAQFAKDQISRRMQLTSPGAYEKWESERRAWVDSMVDKGYVPLRRYGDYSVRVYYEAPDGKRTDIGLEFVDTKRGQHTIATMYREEIARSGAALTVEIGTRDKNQRETGVSIEQFLGTLRRNGVEISQAERERLVLTMTNSESMIRNKMMHREGLSGYSEDSMRVLHEFGVNMSGELAYARFANALDAAAEGRAVTADVNSANSEPEITIDEPLRNEDGSMAETSDEYKARSLWKDGDPMSGFYKGLSDELTNYVLVPDHSGGWSRRLRAAAMVYFIGGSLSAGVVNVMSVPMLLVPELSIHTGYSNSLATTMGAWKDAWRYYHILHDMEKLKSDDPKYAIPGIDANLRQAIAAAADHIFDTEIHQMLGMSQGTVYSKSRNVQRAMEAWMSPFRVSEQTNRLAAFIAAYRVATTGEGVKGRGKLHGQELFKFASGIVDATQNNYNESNRPGAARHPVFAMLFMFKSFPLFMIEAISLMYKQNPRSAVYMLLGLTMMTGVQGLPFAETILDIIDTISQRIFNSPFNARRAMRNAIKAGSEAMVGADLSDVVLRGMLNDVLGVSMASRIGTGDFVPGTRLGTADADSGRVLAEMLGAPFAMVKDAAASVGKFAGGVFTGDWKEAADAIRAGGPVALRNLVKGAEQLNSGFAMDARGRKIVDVNTVDGLLQLGGLSSAKVAKMYDMETINLQTKAFHTQFSQDLQRQLVEAMKAGDTEKVQEVNELRAAWNAQYPQMPILANASATRRAIILSGVPLDQRSRMLWGRRLQGANIFSEEATE